MKFFVLMTSHSFLIMDNISEILKADFAKHLPLDPLPELKPRSPNVPHAPKRNPNLSPAEEKLAIKNALRYFPKELHPKLGKEFYEELKVIMIVYLGIRAHIHVQVQANLSVHSIPIPCFSHPL